MKSMNCARNIAFLLFIIWLGACTKGSERAKSYVPVLTFAHYKTLPLDVGQININSVYNAQKREDNVADLFPTTPEKALLHYFRQRFTAAKDYRTGLAIIVRDAHAIRKRIDKTSGVFSKLTQQGRERYTVFIELALEHRGEEGQLIRRAVLNFRKGLIVPVSLSLAEREARMNGFMLRFMRDIDKGVQSAIRESLHILQARERTDPLMQTDKGLVPGAAF